MKNFLRLREKGNLRTRRDREAKIRSIFVGGRSAVDLSRLLLGARSFVDVKRNFTTATTRFVATMRRTRDLAVHSSTTIFILYSLEVISCELNSEANEI